MRCVIIILLLNILGIEGNAQLILLENPPQNYVCYRSSGEIQMDGQLNETCWENVPWTDNFTDIEGGLKPAPYYRTRVKMLWDDNYLYIAAELEEPHIWATFTERESVIFHENNFEVFIDPDGDTHNYYEYEVNALGTEWDLMLTKPYRFGGLPISAWDIAGMKKGIYLNGTINDPWDTDISWTIEMAFPWKILAEAAPYLSKPKPGNQWRINFSRVQWKLDVADGKYRKTINPETVRSFPEYNWVWSPQHTINMHKPEYWGFVQFSENQAGTEKDAFRNDPDFKIRVILRELFDQQYKYMHKHNRFAVSAQELKISTELFAGIEVTFEASAKRFMLSAVSSEEGYRWFISEDSRIWKAKDNIPREIMP